MKKRFISRLMAGAAALVLFAGIPALPARADSRVVATIGADLTAEHPVLVYDTVSLSPDDYEFTFDGALQPDFCLYEIKKPFRYSVGDVMKLR